MSSKIRKMDTEKLKKYLRNINRCYSIILIAFVFLVILAFASAIIKANNENIIDLVLATFFILGIALILDSISKKFMQELYHRKNEKTIANLTIAGSQKIKLNDFADINLNELLEISETEAVYDSETDVILITFIITGDDGCTKISKTVEFKKDDIISKIEII
ncbi:MAG: hypothetical protein IJE59_04435 [Clostridia bacterium]|nr:hypothetical protein [Clostridia bacterium]